MIRYLIIIAVLVCFLTPIANSFSQKLKAGFNKKEYIELLKLYSKQEGITYEPEFAESKIYKVVYSSPVMALDNSWNLAVSPDSVAVISIRGTTDKPNSLLENFYAAMVPATGKLTLSKKFVFDYSLAENPKAAVHVGWLVAMAYLAQDILPHLNSYHLKNINNVIILGHSQGGAIAYLLTSYVKRLQKQGKLPATIQFKTYCSAAPKPGNLYYAYEYEALTAGGWAFNVVNSADWVPETPISIQTNDDFNNLYPFRNLSSFLRKQPFPNRLAYRYLFNQFDKPTKKAVRKYQKYLGTAAGKYVQAQLPDFVPPQYVNSSNYVRTGQFVVLLADADYYKFFPDIETNIYQHHLLQPYLFLARQLK